MTLRPSSGLRFDGEYLFTRLQDYESGAKIFENQILRVRCSWQWTREWSVRAIVQFDDTDTEPTRTSLEPERNVNADLLLTYQINAGTVAFAGFNTNYRNLDIVESVSPPILQRTGTDLHNDSWQFFVKLSYLFRI